MQKILTAGLTVTALLGATSSARGELMLRQVAGAPAIGSPVCIANAGEDRLFIVQQNGLVKILSEGTVLSTPFLSIQSKISTGGERGLLSIAFHPDYQTNGFFFVNYTDTNGDTVVARYEVSDDPDLADSASEVVLLNIDQPYSNHNGGQLQFGPDGYLYIGMGDGGSGGDPECRAQDDSTLLGKMLRIDVDQNVNTEPYYGIPATNPYVGAGDPLDEIWAKGVRNPWRFSFDRATGDLWVADVGQGNWEEINHAEAPVPGGINYGWKIMEGTHCFSTGACAPGVPACNDASLTLPVYEYNHSNGRCSVTGGYISRGPAAPSIFGKYIFGDYCTGEIFAFDPMDSSVEPLFDGTFGLYTFGEDNSGNLYVAIGNNVYKIEEPSAVDGWMVK